MHCTYVQYMYYNYAVPVFTGAKVHFMFIYVAVAVRTGQILLLDFFYSLLWGKCSQLFASLIFIHVAIAKYILPTFTLPCIQAGVIFQVKNTLDTKYTKKYNSLLWHVLFVLKKMSYVLLLGLCQKCDKIIRWWCQNKLENKYPRKGLSHENWTLHIVRKFSL